MRRKAWRSSVFFRRKRPTKGDEDNSPAGLWLKCDACEAQIYRKDLRANWYLCPECDHHYRLPAEMRVDLLVDEGTFKQWSGEVGPQNPLDFSDNEPYPERLKRSQEKQKRPDAILTGGGLLNGEPVGLAVMDFYFAGGSMGSVVGEEIARAAERSAEEGRAFITVAASGGARMQEGALSLMQMAKTTVALERLAVKSLPFISILTDPTTGGTTASFATLGDVIVAEPKALIGFAGQRVIQQTIKQELPEGFQRAEFLLREGMLDAVIARPDLKEHLATYIRLLRGGLPSLVTTKKAPKTVKVSVSEILNPQAESQPEQVRPKRVQSKQQSKQQDTPPEKEPSVAEGDAVASL